MNVIDNLKILTGQKKDDRLATKPPPPQKTVLIVEDEMPLANILKDRLVEEGFQAMIASNGEEGLTMAAKEIPDLILLDLLMPVMDGKEMLRQLRHIAGCETTPVVILTNAGSIENVRDTQFYSDADEFLIKSNVSMEEVVAKIKDKLLATRIA